MNDESIVTIQNSSFYKSIQLGRNFLQRGFQEEATPAPYNGADVAQKLTCLFFQQQDHIVAAHLQLHLPELFYHLKT